MPNFTIDPATGAGRTTIIVTPSNYNTDGEDRVSTLTLSNSLNSKTVTLRQKYQPVMQQINPTVFPATGGTIYFTVDTEYDIVFRSVPSWITIACNGVTYVEGERISSGVANNQTFTLTADENTGAERSVGTTFNMGHYIGNALQNRVSYFHFTQEEGYQPVPTGTFYLSNTSTYDVYGNATTGDTYNTGNFMVSSVAGSNSGVTHTVPFFIDSMQLTLSPLPSYPQNVTITLRNTSRSGSITAYYDETANAWMSTGWVDVEEGDMLAFELNV